MALVDSTPYPCNVNQDVISSMCMAFAKPVPSHRILEPDQAKRAGGLVTRYEVKFQPA